MWVFVVVVEEWIDELWGRLLRNIIVVVVEEWIVERKLMMCDGRNNCGDCGRVDC